MVATTETLDALKSIGLNLYERKIFVALLAKGIASAAEVSEIASVPRSRSYDVLESLSEKGFVLVQPSKPIKYVALEPKEALERTKDNLKKKHDEMIDRIDRLKASKTLEELDGIHKRGLSLVNTSEMTGTLKGKDNINRHLGSAIKGAKKNIDIITTEDGVKNLHANHFKALKKLNRKGIDVRIAAPIKDGNVASELSQIAMVKSLDEAKGNVFTFDDENMLIGLTGDEVHDTQHVAFWANSEYAAKNHMKNIFDSIWQSSKKK